MMHKPTPHFISQFLQSGMKQQAFCKKHGVPYSRFQYYWKRYKRQQVSPDKAGGFLAVQLRSESAGEMLSGAHQRVRLYVGSECRMEIDGIFTASFLRELAGC